jgi:hypothetical protein
MPDYFSDQDREELSAGGGLTYIQLSCIRASAERMGARALMHLADDIPEIPDADTHPPSDEWKQLHRAHFESKQAARVRRKWRCGRNSRGGRSRIGSRA